MDSLRSAYATATGGGTPGRVPEAGRLPVVPGHEPVAREDLRGTVNRRTLRFPRGRPGRGLRAAGQRQVHADPPRRRPAGRPSAASTRRTSGSAGTRLLPRWLPYAVYRPLVRLAHYAGLRGALASGASVVVHDCGSQSWVRRWLGQGRAYGGGAALHLVLLDVPPETALRGQAERGRAVSGYAFLRHRRAVRQLHRGRRGRAAAGGLRLRGAAGPGRGRGAARRGLRVGARSGERRLCTRTVP